MKKNIGFLIGLFCSICNIRAYAAPIIPDYYMQTYDKVITQLYQDPSLKTQNIQERIDIISAYFLGKPYLGGALGEGKSGLFDQEPIYRTDAFDCLTYVSTVLALTKANTLTEFKQQILKTQYKYAAPTFVNRLHFTSVDWNKVNEQNGLIEDITSTFKNDQGKSIAETATAIINKPAWYQKMTANNLSLLHPLSLEQEKQRIEALHHLSHQVSIEKSVVSYIPLKALFNTEGQPDQRFFDQIPSGSIIEIVRPNWNLKKTIGTHLNISHLGFAIRTPQGLMYREASSLEHRVIDTPLAEYLKNYLNSKTVKGIHIEKVCQ